MIGGRNIIVTGANRGIGKKIVTLFAQNGCNIWACSRRKSEEFEDYINKLSYECNVWIEPVYFELTSENEIKQGFIQINQSKKNIDVLINNAGIGCASTFQMTPMAVVREVFEVDFFAIYFFTQLVLKKMLRQKDGCIINMASIAGMDGNALDTAYGSAKAAVIALTKSLASEVESMGIRVNAIAPGPTDTDMLNIYSEEVREQLEKRSVCGRFVTPDEVAKVALHLAYERSINGQIIRVDGGSE